MEADGYGGNRTTDIVLSTWLEILYRRSAVLLHHFPDQSANTGSLVHPTPLFSRCASGG
ncbi:hypothetical protein TWF694_003882 [Orbilia ellipsospora]|uniref:Uncharacterized protein n=1 Tax=Orbilia ellipsospora TaxID=2528407 RepID=A0AAV9X1T5_9PEZI